jgi:hypothetical protein
MPKVVNQSQAAQYLRISIPTFIKYRRLGHFRTATVLEATSDPRKHPQTGKLIKPRTIARFNLEALCLPNAHEANQ